MSYADQKATSHQSNVLSNAAIMGSRYDDDEVRNAIVRAREDMLLLVSYLSSVNSQLPTIKTALLGILIVLIYIAVKTN